MREKEDMRERETYYYTGWSKCEERPRLDGAS